MSEEFNLGDIHRSLPSNWWFMSCEFRNTPTGFDADASIGASINQSLKECLVKARSSGVTVTLRNFNGVDVTVAPTATIEEVETVWQSAMDRIAEEYRNSPAGRKEAREAKERLKHSQHECDRLLAQLESYDDHPATDKIVAWVAEFSEYADHIGVKYDMAALISKLEQFGYVANAHVAKSNREKKNVKNLSRQVMGEYIIGQAISCIKNGMPPHPVVMRFAKEYAEMSV